MSENIESSTTINNDLKPKVIDYIALQKQVLENERQKAIELKKDENKRKHTLLFYVGILYFVMMCLLIGVRIVSSLGLFDSLDNILNDLVSSSIIQILIMFSFPIVFFSIFKKQKVKNTFKDFKFKKTKFSIILISIAIGFLVFWLNGFISSIFSFIISIFGYESLPTSYTTKQVDSSSILFIITSIVCSCIMPAICEETAHRGMLLASIKRYGVAKAILLSGLMFGLVHLSINQFFYASIIGCFLAFLTVISDSIYPAMIVHFMNNFLSTCSELLTANGFGIFDLSKFLQFLDNVFGEWLANFIVFIFLIFSVLLVVYLSYVIYKKCKYKSVLEKIKKENFAYFYHLNNIDENGNTKVETMRKFFSTDNLEFGSLLYLSDKKKENSNFKMLNYLDDVYIESKGNLFNFTFIISSICTSALVTIFTFIWGTL